MELAEWIEEHRTDIDDTVRAILGHVPRQASCRCYMSGTDHQHDDVRTPADDDERETWVLNDEGLYLWAVGDGVEV